MNISRDEEKILLITWIVAACITWIQVPILVFTGPPGSAKSSGAQFVKMLIDPDSSLLTRMPNNERDLAIAALNCFCLAFDNLRRLNEKESDFLCNVVTGGTFKTRKLFSDTEEICISLTKRVILTGINNVVTEADLVDRSIVFNMSRIDSNKYLSNSGIIDRFAADLPIILGGLYEMISEILNMLPSIKTKETTRFVDFSKVGAAVEKILGYREGFFQESYDQIRRRAFLGLIYQNPVTEAMSELIDNDEKLLLTASELDILLKKRAAEAGISLQSWPQSPRALSASIRKNEEILHRMGFIIKFDINQDRKKRLISITSNTKNNAEKKQSEEENLATESCVITCNVKKFSLKEYQLPE